MKKCILVIIALCATSLINAADLIEVLPVNDRILRLTFDEGYIEKHKYHEPSNTDKTHQWPLNLIMATDPNSYKLSSKDDKEYFGGRHPEKIGRKSKGHDFSKKCKRWYEEPWPDAACKNDFIPYHYIYLELPNSLKSGKTYQLDVASLSDHINKWEFKYDEFETRSVALHLNQMGYVPDAPRKYAYISHWMGDLGPLEMANMENRAFTIKKLDDTGNPGKTIFKGQLTKQKDLQTGGPDTDQTERSVMENFVGADVWQADFSELKIPGNYVLGVEGIGASFPFRIGADVYYEPFYYSARALYFQRSTIARPEEYAGNKPYPAWKNRHVVYTSIRTMDLTDESGRNQKQRIFDSIQWDFDVSNMRGWYHDAGDWDGYYSHFKVPRYLMWSYELNAKNYTDGELNIPEAQKANGYHNTHIPDILDEAVWLVDYFKNNIGPTGGIFGARVEPDISKKEDLNNVEELINKGFHFADCKPEGIPSWEDCTTYIVFGEDPRDSYAYAGLAAQYAYSLKLAARHTGENYEVIIRDYLASAEKAYQWAGNNIRPGDYDHRGGSHNYGSLKNAKTIAAAWLYKTTGKESFHKDFENNIPRFSMNNYDLGELKWAVWAYATIDRSKRLYVSMNHQLQDNLRDAAISYGHFMVHDAIKKNRSMRMGGKWDQAVLNGHGTTPWILPAAIAEQISIQSDKPKEAVQFETACYLTADYFLGGNPLNYVWLTGVGHKQPEQIMHHDSEYYPDGQYTLPGVPPYGPRPRCDWFAPMNSTHPHKGDKCYYNNSHDADFALMHGRIYPPYYNEDGKMQWPVHELFFNNYGSPPTNEYTIHQTIAPAAAAYGFLKRDATGTDSLNEAPGINIKIKDDTHNKLLIDATDQDGWIYSIKVYLDNHLIAVSKKNIELITLDFPETIREGNIWVIASDNLGQTSKSNILKIQKKQ